MVPIVKKKYPEKTYFEKKESPEKKSPEKKSPEKKSPEKKSPVKSEFFSENSSNPKVFRSHGIKEEKLEGKFEKLEVSTQRKSFYRSSENRFSKYEIVNSLTSEKVSKINIAKKKDIYNAKDFDSNNSLMMNLIKILTPSTKPRIPRLYKLHNPNCQCFIGKYGYSSPKHCMVACGEQGAPTILQNVLWICEFDSIEHVQNDYIRALDEFSELKSSAERTIVNPEICFAKCILQSENNQNGFVFLNGSHQLISKLAESALFEKLNKSSDQSCAEDEADNFHCLPISLLARLKNKDKRGLDDLHQMYPEFSKRKIKLHYHLESAISSFYNKSVKDDLTSDFCFVFSWFDEKDNTSVIDIPGGKRTVYGESAKFEDSIEAAIRETSEECLIDLDFDRSNNEVIVSCKLSNSHFFAKMTESAIDKSKTMKTFRVELLEDISLDSVDTGFQRCLNNKISDYRKSPTFNRGSSDNFLIDKSCSEVFEFQNDITSRLDILLEMSEDDLEIIAEDLYSSSLKIADPTCSSISNLIDNTSLEYSFSDLDISKSTSKSRNENYSR